MVGMGGGATGPAGPPEGTGALPLPGAGPDWGGDGRKTSVKRAGAGALVSGPHSLWNLVNENVSGISCCGETGSRRRYASGASCSGSMRPISGISWTNARGE